MKNIITAAALLLVINVYAQKSTPVQFSLEGGIKRNIFHTVKTDIAAFNITSGYDPNLVTPNVKNTWSFFSSFSTSKKVSKHFAINNTIGLDMQQLSIESGFKRRVMATGVTSYSREYTSELLPRLKVGFGVDYNLSSRGRNQFAIGLNAGEMIRLSARGYSYSFVGAGVSYATRNVKLFATGSLTPYNVSLPNMQNYIGDMGADVIGTFEYRVYEVAAGVGIRL
jgi:hypothetical protein